VDTQTVKVGDMVRYYDYTRELWTSGVVTAVNVPVKWFGSAPGVEIDGRHLRMYGRPHMPHDSFYLGE